MGSTGFRSVSKAVVTGALTLSSLLAACGDDDGRKRSDEESPATGEDASIDSGANASEGGAPVAGDAAGRPFDASSDAASVDAGATTEFDAATQPGGGSVGEGGVADARAQAPGPTDASVDSAQPNGSAPDAAVPDAQVRADASSPPSTDSAAPQPSDGGAASDTGADGGSTPAAGDARVDSGPAAGDASARDASATSDGSASRDAGGPGSCDVRDPRFGCGESAGEWVHFESGFSYDRSSGLLWARPGTTTDNQNDRNEGCAGLDLDGVDPFRLPTVREVARLSAGCGEPCLEGVGDCRPCEAGDGPHVNGGYCRPELPDCQAVFTVDTCEVGSTSVRCPSPRHWYYDERIGIFRLLDTGDRAPGTCVAQVTTPVP